MNAAILEHINITVTDPDGYAKTLCNMFGWHIRWAGPAQEKGYTVHVRGKDSYMALYRQKPAADKTVTTISVLNHIAVRVADLQSTETRVEAAGYTPFNHGNYAPGRRFYFHDEHGIEFEVVSYQTEKQAMRTEIIRMLGTMSRFGALIK